MRAVIAIALNSVALLACKLAVIVVEGGKYAKKRHRLTGLSAFFRVYDIVGVREMVCEV